MAHKKATVITTAPTDRQVRQVIWHEIRAIHHAHQDLIGGRINAQSLYLDHRRCAFGFATNSAQRFLGIHQQNMLTVIDAAHAVKSEICEAAEMSTASHNAKMLMVGTQHDNHGYFNDAFQMKKTSWKLIRPTTQNVITKHSMHPHSSIHSPDISTTAIGMLEPQTSSETRHGRMPRNDRKMSVTDLQNSSHHRQLRNNCAIEPKVELANKTNGHQGQPRKTERRTQTAPPKSQPQQERRKLINENPETQNQPPKTSAKTTKQSQQTATPTKPCQLHQP